MGPYGWDAKGLSGRSSFYLAQLRGGPNLFGETTISGSSFCLEVCSENEP